MKKYFAFLLCFCLLVSLAACGETSDPSGSTGTQSLSETNTDASSETDTQSLTSSSDSESNADDVQLYDPTMEHKVIMDDSDTKILVADLNLCGENPEDIEIEDCIIWEWDTNDAVGTPIYGKKVTMDEAGFRYSAYWDRDVIIFCGSGGWVGIVDYESKELLFSDNPGKGPHSVELLPNGDLIVACSGNSTSSDGRVLYYPLSEGRTDIGSVLPLKSAHGVCWDPTNEVIWALGGDEIIACIVSSGSLTEIEGMGASLKSIGHSGGHDLVPVYGQPGKYYVSCTKKILMFDANEGKISESFVRSNSYKGESVKGIAWFADGTMVLTAHDQGGTGTYRSSEFRFLYLGMSSGKVKVVKVKELVIPHRAGSQTYKVHTFTKDYQ